MTNVVTSYNNFARAKIDHDMQGRYELPIYSTGADIVQNFITNFKGNAIYRSAFEDMILFQDCAFVEFKYSDNQNYLIVMYNLKMRFVSYDVSGNLGWVESSPGVPLEVTTPYTLAQSKQIAKGKPSQNFDAMYFTLNGFEPRKLIRTSATTFTFEVFARKDDPFPTTFAGNKTISGATLATNSNLTIVGHGYSVGDRIKITGLAGIIQLNNYTARVVTVPGVDNVTIDVDTTTFTAFSGNGVANKVTAGDYPAHNLFYGSKLYYAATTLRTTTIWGSEDGLYDIFTLPATVLATSALRFTLAEFSQKIEWLFKGDNSMIVGSADGIIAVNGGSVNTAITAETVDTTPTSAEGCNGVYPFKKDGLIFYIGKNNRNMYYFSYDVLSETFGAEDANFISYDVTDGLVTKLRFKKDRDDLIYELKADYNFNTCNFNTKEKIIGWHEHNVAGETLTAEMHDFACITDNVGNPQIFALNKYGSAYYIERQAEYVRFKERVKFFSGSSAVDKLADDIAYNRYVAEQLKQCLYLDNALTFSNLKSNLITYAGAIIVESLGTITATTPVFSINDEGKHIVYQTATGYESGRFKIINYVSTTVVDVEVLQEPSSVTYTNWYLSFTIVSGLGQYNGTTIGIVTDGGYYKDAAISGGVTEFPGQVTHAVFGYRYKGIIKSFPLGFVYQTENTQTTVKNISQFHIRTTASAGLSVGESLYKLEAVQELTPDDINYLPPRPLDGTKTVIFSGDFVQDKCFYAVQDQPLPAIINSIMITGNYTLTP